MIQKWKKKWCPTAHTKEDLLSNLLRQTPASINCCTPKLTSQEGKTVICEDPGYSEGAFEFHSWDGKKTIDKRTVGNSFMKMASRKLFLNKKQDKYSGQMRPEHFGPNSACAFMQRNKSEDELEHSTSHWETWCWQQLAVWMLFNVRDREVKPKSRGFFIKT